MKLETSTQLKRCSQCGESFGCGAASGACWCFAMPKLLPVPSNKNVGCLCPRCLEVALQQQRNAERIETVPPATFAFMRHVGPYGPAITPLWNTLRDWAEPLGIWTSTTYSFGISHDNPMTTPPALCRYDACVEISPDLKFEGAGRGQMPGGLYLLVPFQGTAAQIGKAFDRAMHESLPQSLREFDFTRPIFERYHGKMKSEDASFSCELCIPVR